VITGPSGFAVPLNAVPAVAFNEPLSVASVNGETVIFQRDSATGNGVTTVADLSLSPDGRTILVTPAQLLEPHTNYGVTIVNIRDLSGNASSSVGFQFNTGATVDLTPPQLSFAAPASGATGVPINQPVVLVFDSMLQPGSIGESVRIEKNGQPIAIERLVGNEVLELKPQKLLEPFTVYRWDAEGLRDLAGNPQAAPFSGTFTTGASIDLSPLKLESATPQDGAANVSRNVVISYRYSAEFNPRTIYVDPFGLRDMSTNNLIPYRVSYSQDLKTLYVMPTAPLPANTPIQVSHSVGAVVSIIGSSGAQPDGFTFTTGN
jgi:hypothetical protein